MPPSLALFLWLICLLALLRYDPAREPETSLALWIPLIWIFITASRLPSQWLGSEVGSAAQAFEEGNPLDRTIFFVLILLAIGILISRSFNWGTFFARNLILVAFVSFALVSVLWSDFPLVTIKRWYRDLGNYLVILVVLSDSRPLEAVRALLRRLSYLLIPLSILMVKYYPQIGRHYSGWTGAVEYVGPTTGKNLLGVMCLISGIFFFWDTMTRWPERKERRTKRIIIVNFAFIAMTLWLLKLANSATSRVCLVIGCLVIVAAHNKWVKRHPRFLKVLLPACFCLYLLLALGFGVNADLARAVGRDPTLTDRTLIWKTLLAIDTNPIVGTGYESFWLGPRLQRVWQTIWVNEAHNGYLEVYLNLGLIGLVLLVGFLAATYRNICKRLTPFSNLASLSLAFWLIILFYNVTEAAFKYHLIWVIFLLVCIAVPERLEKQLRSVTAPRNADDAPRFPRLSLEPRVCRGVNAVGRLRSKIGS
jgi:exopolysaccharide production protein ExoQ